MEKYLFKNCKTYPFKKKSFEGQLGRYAKVCIVNVDNPEKIIDIIPIYGEKYNKGLGRVIKLFYDIELNVPLDSESNRLLAFLQKPIEGKFEEVKSLHGPLYRQFTPDEAKYGLCHANDVWKPERDENGKVKLYNTMKMFTQYMYDPDLGAYNYVPGWFPNQMYYKYFGYRYLPISQLKESL